MRQKTSSAKWRLFCPGGDEITLNSCLPSWGHTIQLNLPSGLPFVFIYEGTDTVYRAYTIVEHSGILEKKCSHTLVFNFGCLLRLQIACICIYIYIYIIYIYYAKCFWNFCPCVWILNEANVNLNKWDLELHNNRSLLNAYCDITGLWYFLMKFGNMFTVI